MSGQAAGLGQRALQHAFPSSCSQEMVGLSLWEWANFLVPVVGGLCLVLSPGCVFSVSAKMSLQRGEDVGRVVGCFPPSWGDGFSEPLQTMRVSQH